MSTIFRIATTQAIKEIIEDSAVAGRFGHIVTTESMEDICKKVVDLFEMTLELRAKTQEIFSGTQSATDTNSSRLGQDRRASARSNRMDFKEESNFSTPKNGAEVYTTQNQTRAGQASLRTGLDLRLPRQRVELTHGEREKLARR